MPLLSGYNLIRQVRDRCHRVPMIALTAFDTPEHRLQAFLHGFACRLTKPFDSEQLVAAVGETVGTEAMRPSESTVRPDSEAE